MERNVRTVTQTLLVLMLVTVAGCGDARIRAANRPSPPSVPVYLDSAPRFVPRSRIERYACLNGQPLLCHCSGIVGGCECRCPLPYEIPHR